jgi:hypothetical protein
VLSAVNRSLAALQERIDRLHPTGIRPADGPHAIAS